MLKVHWLLFVMFWGSGQIAHASVDASAEREELAEARVTPFKKEVSAVDPLSKQPVDRVLIGPAYKAKKGADFDYYRYVTFYNVLSRRERFSEWPVQREQCDDDSDFFGGWSKAIGYTRTVNASVSYEGLGLGATFTETTTVTTNRNVKAHGKAVVDHVPYMIKEDWEGVTYVQTANLKSGRETLIVNQQNRTPFWFAILFPLLAQREYPMPFSARNAEWILDVEHRKVSDCPPRK